MADHHIQTLKERREYLGERIAAKTRVGGETTHDVREHEALGWAIARCLWVMREVSPAAALRTPRAPDPDDDGA